MQYYKTIDELLKGIGDVSQSAVYKDLREGASATQRRVSAIATGKELPYTGVLNSDLKAPNIVNRIARTGEYTNPYLSPTKDVSQAYRITRDNTRVGSVPSQTTQTPTVGRGLSAMWNNFLSSSVNAYRQATSIGNVLNLQKLRTDEQKLQDAKWAEETLNNAPDWIVNNLQRRALDPITKTQVEVLNAKLKNEESVKAVETRLREKAGVENLKGGWKKAAQVAGALPSTLEALIPVYGWHILATTSVNNSLENTIETAKRKGQSFDYNMAYIKAFGDAGIDVATELMFGAVGGAATNLSKLAAFKSTTGFVSSLLRPVTSKISKSVLGDFAQLSLPKLGLRILTSSQGEGIEELVAYVASGYLAKLTTQQDISAWGTNDQDALMSIAGMIDAYTTGALAAGPTSIVASGIGFVKTREAAKKINKPVSQFTEADWNVYAKAIHEDMQNKQNQEAVTANNIDIISKAKTQQESVQEQVNISDLGGVAKYDNIKYPDEVMSEIRSKLPPAPTQDQVASLPTPAEILGQMQEYGPRDTNAVFQDLLNPQAKQPDLPQSWYDYLNQPVAPEQAEPAITFTGAGQAITDNMYESIWNDLKSGVDRTGGKAPLFEQVAKRLYDEYVLGNISDLKRLGKDMSNVTTPDEAMEVYNRWRSPVQGGIAPLQTQDTSMPIEAVGTLPTAPQPLVRASEDMPTTAVAETPIVTRKSVETKISRGQDARADVAEYIKTEEGKKLVEGLNTPEDVALKLAELKANNKGKNKYDLGDYLQLLAISEHSKSMPDTPENIDKRRYLAHILEAIGSGKSQEMKNWYEQLFSESQLLYKVFANEDAIKIAENRIRRYGKNANAEAKMRLDELYEGRVTPNPDDVVEINEYIKRLLEANTEESDREFADAAYKISELGTSGGQFIQSLSLLSKSLPTMQAQKLEMEYNRASNVPKMDEVKVIEKAKATAGNVKEAIKDSAIGAAKTLEDIVKKGEPIAKVPKSVAQRVADYVKKYASMDVPNKKVRTFNDRMVSALTAKASETLVRTPAEKEDIYATVAELVMNLEQNQDSWNEAQKIIKAEPDLASRSELAQYLQTWADPIMAKKYMASLVTENIRRMDVPISQLAKDYFLKGDESIQGFVQEMYKHMPPDLEAKTYRYIEKYVVAEYKKKLDARRTTEVESLKKKIAAGKISKPYREEQEVMIDMLSSAAYRGEFDLQETQDAWAKKLGVSTFTSEMRTKTIDAMKAYARAKTQEQKDEIYDNLTAYLSAQLKATKPEKVTAFLATSMLLNPRTLTKNALTNYANFVPFGLTNRLAGAFQKAQKLSQDVRTVGDKYLTMKSDHPAVELAKKLVSSPAYIRRIIDQTEKYTVATGMRRNMTVFNNRFLENARKSSMQLLQTGQLNINGKLSKFQIKPWGDTLAFQHAYVIAFANKLAAQGYAETTSEADAKAMIKNAEEHATENAKEATYRNKVGMANILQNTIKGAVDYEQIRRLESDPNNKANLAKAAELRKQGETYKSILKMVFPFVMTPAAVVSTGYKYSPLALAKSVLFDYVAAKATGRYKNYSDAKKAIVSRKIAQSLVGTTTSFALGLLLASMGFLTGAAPEKDKEKAAWALQGKRAYSIYIPGVGSVSIDWMQPISVGLVMGAQVWQALTSNESLWEKAVGTGKATIDSLLTNSILDNQAFKLGYGDTGPSATVGNILSGGVMQGVPSLFKQFAKVVDPYVRDAYTGNAIQVMAKKYLAGVPFASYLVPPKIDIWGNPVRQIKGSGAEGVAERFFLNMFAPFLVAENQMDETTKEVVRIFNATKDSVGTDALPSAPQSSFTVNDGGIKYDYALTGKDYAEYAKIVGELYKESAKSVLGSGSDEVMAKALGDAYAEDRKQAAWEWYIDHPTPVSAKN